KYAFSCATASSSNGVDSSWPHSRQYSCAPVWTQVSPSSTAEIAIGPSGESVNMYFAPSLGALVFQAIATPVPSVRSATGSSDGPRSPTDTASHTPATAATPRPRTPAPAGRRPTPAAGRP